MAKFSEELTEKLTTMIAEDFLSVTEICRATGISRNTFYKWKRENPGFDREITEATELRNDALLSKAFSALRERLERHTLVEEKDIYVPDEANSGGLVFKSKVIRKRECLPDLRSIKMVLDRNDKKEAMCHVEKPVETVNNMPVEAVSDSVDERVGKENISFPVIADRTDIKPKERSKKSNKQNTAIKNIKSNITILNGKKTPFGRKERLRETA